jgi:ABC-2 type transport system ATP-binding protein
MLMPQYGLTRQVDVEFSDNFILKPAKNVKIEVLDETNGRNIRLTFDSSKVRINELMSELLAQYDVKDFTVTEPGIEGLIRQIYEGSIKLK